MLRVSTKVGTEYILAVVQVVKCAISPCSKLAATATQDHSIQIWELPSGRILQDLTVSLKVHLSVSCSIDMALISLVPA